MIAVIAVVGAVTVAFRVPLVVFPVAPSAVPTGNAPMPTPAESPPRISSGRAALEVIAAQYHPGVIVVVTGAPDKPKVTTPLAIVLPAIGPVCTWRGTLAVAPIHPGPYSPMSYTFAVLSTVVASKVMKLKEVTAAPA
jgi:hypothetical protein